MSEPWGLGLGGAVVAGVLLGAAAVPVVLAAVVIFQVMRGRRNLIFAGCIVVAAAIGAGRLHLADETHVPIDFMESTGAQVRVDSLPRISRGGISALVEVGELRFDREERPAGNLVLLAWFPDDVRVAPGDRLDVEWSVQPLSMVDPGYRAYLESRGAMATAFIDWIPEHREGSPVLHRLIDVRQRISESLRQAIPGDAGALAAGIVTGDDSALTEGVDDAFIRTGTSHITAVSGANVAILLAVWNLVIPAGRNRRLLAVQLVIITSIWLYAILVGLEAPALRAAAMATLILIASRAGRRPDLLTLLALTSAAMVLWNPDFVRMPAFWLSVTATAAIVLRVPGDAVPGWRRTLRGMLEGVVLAQLATLPIVLWAFGSWSLTSVLANWLLAPLVWLAFPACFILAAIVMVLPWPALDALIAWPARVILDLAIKVVTGFNTANVPLDFTNAGPGAVLAVAIPVVIALALVSSEFQRWEPAMRDAWRLRPVAISAVTIGPICGVLAALSLTLWQR